MAVIWITHDLGVVAGMAQRLIVMYAGYIIEEAPVKEVYANPTHPYTLGLLKSLPRLDSRERYRLVTIPGLPPLLLEKPTACPFSPRCPYVFERCQENPPLFDVGVEHRAACWWNVEEERPRNV
jgi:oligopeptide transport system ATP-binding protein